MTTPPFLVGAAVVFWGWETGLLLPAALAALVLEGSRLVRWRLELSPRDFNHISDLSALLLAGGAIWIFTRSGVLRTVDGPRAITVLFQRLPLFLVLLVAAQAYSTAGRVPLSAFFWTLRRKVARGGATPGPVDLSYAYGVACVLAASAANVRTPVFYATLCALAAWALWPERSPRFSPAWWAAFLAVVVTIGWGGQAVLHRAQERIEQAVFDYLFNMLRRRDTDPFRSSTAIGRLGELKLSDRILLRVEPGPGVRMPLLLREASYNVYSTPAWFAIGAAFSPVQAEADGETWKFAPGPRSALGVGVSAYLPHGSGVLGLPAGAFQIDRLAAVRVSRNALGAVKVDEGLGLVRYRALVGGASVLDGLPGPVDLDVPRREAPVLGRIAAELDLAGKTSAERVRTVAAFFGTRFHYSTYQRVRPTGVAALEDFLLRTRAGHCEYFATATVLLLRAAGVPARYAVGYSVQEWSPLERVWIVRARHAHAWALVWVDGAWRDLDTTPAVWASEEGARASRLQPVADVWAWVQYLFARWRYGETEGGPAGWLGWLLVPLALALAWRLAKRRRRSGGAPGVEARHPHTLRPGEDSEFYLIERALEGEGLGRWPSEPASAWVRRLGDAGAPAVDALPAILDLHYRHRFDPAGLGAHERAALRERVEAWLAARPAPH